MSGRSVPDRTLEGIAAELGLEKQDVHKALRGLEKWRPQLAHPDVDAGWGAQFWMSTPDAAEVVD
jgi:hypothetical protein